MKLSYLYKQIVKFGIDRDPRKHSSVRSFEDTALLYGNPDTEVKKILVGIDMEVGELLLADQLRRKQGLDLVIAHHPEGAALAGLYEVMRLQVDQLIKLGLKQAVARELTEERIREVQRSLHSSNHMRSVDAARLLDMPFMCVHTPADNHVADFLQQLLNHQKSSSVQEIVDILLQIPEYKDGAANLAGPRIILGAPNRPAGKTFVDMTGGTEGSKDVFDKMYKSGVRTLVGMHFGPEHFKKAKDANLNIVVAGHIASDNLGLNLLFDRIESHFKEKLEILNCSGFRRISRTKDKK